MWEPGQIARRRPDAAAVGSCAPRKNSGGKGLDYALIALIASLELMDMINENERGKPPLAVRFGFT